jgi:putative aldouronate transport system permease protein
MPQSVTSAKATESTKSAPILIKQSSIITFMFKHRALYIMLIPALVYLLIFKYVPLAGSIIAFQDYNIYKGFLASDWVGFKWFEQFFTYPQFTRLLWNTLMISLYQIIFAFPAPIILALLLNEIKNNTFMRTVQTVLYLPHFLSWVVIGGLGYMLLSPQVGLLNQLITATGAEPIHFLQDSPYFRTIIVTSGIWKEMGWNAIIFLAALAGISPSLYEAARIDGAGRWNQFVHVTLPGIMPAVMLILLLKIGHTLDLGFEQIYIFLNPITFETGDVLDTYSYREGIIQGQYSMTSAIGLFKAVVGFCLLVIANRASKATTGQGIF